MLTEGQDVVRIVESIIMPREEEVNFKFVASTGVFWVPPTERDTKLQLNCSSSCTV